MLNKKFFLFGSLIGFVLIISFFLSLPDGKLHVVFCDVGQGDAAYIRTPSNQDMLIDGGPDDRVLSCLGRHMPFYDRTIDVVLLTHPQKDHLQGLISVVQRYNVKYFIIGVEGNETAGYKLLVENLKKKNIPIKNLYTGDKFYLGKVEFDVLWPDKKWVADKVQSSKIKAQSLVGAVLGLSTDTELNDFSYYLNLKYGTFSTLFTGDGDVHMQPEVMKIGDLPQVTVLKFPHHGSKTAMLPMFLDKLAPELAVISVGKNSYGHPTKEALNMLLDNSIQYKQTDKEGDIEVVSNGKIWYSD